MNSFQVTLDGTSLTAFDVTLADTAVTYAVSIVGSGPMGPPGPAGIIVSETAPLNPVEGQLWLQLIP